jgi:hypothetical protein
MNNDDFTTVNEAYFAHVDWFLNQAAARGMVVLLVPSYMGAGCGDEGWCGEMRANGVNKLTQYGQYLGNRYKNFGNIIWVEGGDYTPGSSDLKLVTAIADGIDSAENGVHLQTAHWSRGTASSKVSNIPWLDLGASYTGDGAHTYVKTLADVARDAEMRPDFLIESYYENEHGTSRLALRSQMYQPLLSGETGFFFGNDPIWYFGTVNDSNPGWNFPDHDSLSWNQSLGTAGAKSVSVVTNLFSGLRWYDLVADRAHEVMTGGYGSSGSDSYALAASTADGTLMVAYLTAYLTPTVDMSRFSAPMIAQWIDPASGTVTAISGSPFANNGDRKFTPPANKTSAGDTDWVLLIKKP